MSRGYPRAYGATGARTVAVARPVASAQLSLRALMGAALRVPKVPPPHPALLIGVGAAVAIGYGLKYLAESGDTEDVPAPLAPPLYFRPGGLSVHTGLTFIEEKVGQRFNQWNAVPKQAGHLADTTSGSPIGSAFIPSDRYKAIGGWQAGGLDVASVGPGVYYALSTELRQTDETRWWSTNKVRIYRNNTAAAVPPIVDAPARPLPMLNIGDLAPARPEVRIDHPGLILTFPETRVDPIRGVGWNAQTGAQVAAMAPAKLEVKAQASPALTLLIARSFGAVGDSIDLTRCFMYATGNTYTTRNGVEKAIPKWQWGAALGELSRSTGPKDFNKHRHSRPNTNGNILTGDGRILTPSDVGHRLGKCIVLSQGMDALVGLQSKVMSRAGREMGLTAGPFNVQSWATALGGGTPYEGLFDLNL